MPTRVHSWDVIIPFEDTDLQHSLRLLWKLTYSAGFLPDWCRQIPRTRASTVANHVGTIFATVFLLFMASYQLVQFIVQVQTVTTIHSIIDNVMWLNIYLTGLLVNIVCLYQRRRLLQFFDQWAIFQKQPLMRRHPLSSSGGISTRAICYFYSLVAIAYVGGNVYSLIEDPSASSMLSHYDVLRQRLTMPVIFTSQILGGFYNSICNFMSEVVPMITYNHVAMAITSLEEEVKLLFRVSGRRKFESRERAVKINMWIDAETPKHLEKTIVLVASQYERIRKMVAAANQLFGLVMIVADGAIFVMITIVVYTLFHSYKTAMVKFVECLLFFVIFFVRLVSSVVLKDRLQRSSAKFKSTVARLLCSNWYCLSITERNAMVNLINHVEGSSVCVAPLDLYLVNRKTLLSMFSIAVSFTIILLQSK